MNRGSLLHTLPALALGVGVALFSATELEAKDDQGPLASFVKGTVEVGAAADGKFAKLKRNRPVGVGQFVRTGENSRAELKFPDGSLLRIGPSSLLHVQASSFNGKTQEVNVDATVVGGKAWAKVSKLVGSEAKFNVKSANAVAGVRGTVFRINVDQDDATVVKVYDGAVAVSNSPFFADKPDGKKANSPVDFEGRKQIANPFTEVSKKEYEQIVARMMEVRVGKDGTMSKASAFTSDADKLEDPDWVNWNVACDSGNCDAY
jgi:ferric-dicitrate binding protein FerR (iron transport regulator)